MTEIDFDALEENARRAQEEAAPLSGGRLEDYYYDASQDCFWCADTAMPLPHNGLNAEIPRAQWEVGEDARGNAVRIKPSDTLREFARGHVVRGTAWEPGLPTIIHDFVYNDAGKVYRPGYQTLNLYLAPPERDLRDDRNPDMWLTHVRGLIPEKEMSEHFFDYCAHTVQKPHEKINHGIILYGAQGTGKDTAMLPIISAIGFHNTRTIGPDELNKRFNNFIKSILLIVNETRAQKEEHHASTQYNILKPLTAAPPEFLMLEMKRKDVIPVRNVVRTIVMTNEQRSFYLPEGDRRFYPINCVHAISDLEERKAYFNDLWAYLDDGGVDAVVRWLKNRDISQFDPKAVPKTTQDKQQMIDNSDLRNFSVIAETFDDLTDAAFKGNRPTVWFPFDLTNYLSSEFGDDEHRLKKVRSILSTRRILHEAGDLGYEAVKYQYGTRWVVGPHKTRVAFVAEEIPTQLRQRLVESMIEKREKKPLNYVKVEAAKNGDDAASNVTKFPEKK